MRIAPPPEGEFQRAPFFSEDHDAASSIVRFTQREAAVRRFRIDFGLAVSGDDGGAPALTGPESPGPRHRRVTAMPLGERDDQRWPSATQLVQKPDGGRNSTQPRPAAQRERISGSGMSNEAQRVDMRRLDKHMYGRDR